MLGRFSFTVEGRLSGTTGTMGGEPRCCGCCCGIKQGLMWYLGVSFVLSLLSILSFAPLPNAPNGGLFVTDAIVDDAKEYCARVPACNQACSCNVWSEKDCDFEDMATLYEAGWGIGFGLTILAVALYAVALVGVWSKRPWNPHQRRRQPNLEGLALERPRRFNSNSSSLSSYSNPRPAPPPNVTRQQRRLEVQRARSFGNELTVDALTFSICCASFEDDVDRLLTLGIAGGWIVYFIQMAVVASQVFEVRVLIAYLTKAT